MRFVPSPAKVVVTPPTAVIAANDSERISAENVLRRFLRLPPGAAPFAGGEPTAKVSLTKFMFLLPDCGFFINIFTSDR